MEKVTIEAKLREKVGKNSSKQARREKAVPCIIYGGESNIPVVCDAKSFKKLVYTPEFRLAEVNVNGSAHKCILKDIQFHPVSDEIVHADFLKLADGVNIKVQVPLRIKGTSPGVKVGGKLMQLLRKVNIKTTPEHLIDKLYIDISSLKLGASLRIKDIEVPEGVQIMNASGIPVVSVEVPRALKSAAAKEAKDAAAKAKAAK
ncbi:MAG: 50S ribosomal protein L25 [Saprospirales bacterium]|jgi:large subunit ribosomal protein L25|nr:MAG: 50S ribosomal protein L25 [Saprospirales bacterium]